MSLFTCVIEAKLTASPERGATRDGRVYVQFPVVHRDRYRDSTGRWVDTKPMFVDILCWGELASRAENLVRGDTVVIEVGTLMPYITDSELPRLKAYARNLSLSMRFADAHAGTHTRQRRGDVIVTPDGEHYDADAYPEAVTDRELVHR